MASMTIRGIDDGLKKKLRMQAALHGCSMEEEARDILRAALSTEQSNSGTSLLNAIRTRVAPLGGIDLDLPNREVIRNPPQFP